MHAVLPVVLFVDLQEGFLGQVRTLSSAQVRRGAGALSRIAAALGIPVVASGISAGEIGAPPLIDEICRALPDLKADIRVGFDALAAAPTRSALQPQPGRMLLLAGVSTEAAVYATARSALREGFDVRLVLDACAGLSQRTEDAALRHLEKLGAIPTSIASVLTELPMELGSAANLSAMQVLRDFLHGSPSEVPAEG